MAGWIAVVAELWLHFAAAMLLRSRDGCYYDPRLKLVGVGCHSYIVVVSLGSDDRCGWLSCCCCRVVVAAKQRWLLQQSLVDIAGVGCRCYIVDASIEGDIKCGWLSCCCSRMLLLLIAAAISLLIRNGCYDSPRLICLVLAATAT